MPGKKITDHQVQKYKQHHLKLSQVASAAKAGISERSARRIEQREALPSQREERAWRTREDPLAPVWDSEIVPLLETDGALNAVTLLEELQRRCHSESKVRPLAMEQAKFNELFAARRVDYELAQFRVQTLNKPVKRITAEIERLLTAAEVEE